MTDPKIPARDQIAIDEAVETFRHALENIAKRVYLQGQIDQIDTTIARFSRDRDTEPPDEFNREGAE